MDAVQVLSEDLANKIAAREKELVENVIDAKSTRIFVSLLEGGIRLIQVTDGGEGMTRDEVPFNNPPVCFSQHAVGW